MSDYQKQVGKQMFDLLEPFEHEFSIVDAVRGLSKVCRFNGHITAPHYSVAQHMVLVSVIAEGLGGYEEGWNGLCHDLAEA